MGADRHRVLQRPSRQPARRESPSAWASGCTHPRCQAACSFRSLGCAVHRIAICGQRIPVEGHLLANLWVPANDGDAAFVFRILDNLPRSARGRHPGRGNAGGEVVGRDGSATTPDATNLPSITVAQYANIVAPTGWKFRHAPLRLAHLKSARLVLAVNSAAPFRALSRVNDDRLQVDHGVLHTLAAPFVDILGEVV